MNSYFSEEPKEKTPAIHEDRLTLAKALPLEIKRVRDLVEIYKELGPASSIAISLMNVDLDKATDSIMHGDIHKMISSYQKLKTWE